MTDQPESTPALRLCAFELLPQPLLIFDATGALLDSNLAARTLLATDASQRIEMQLCESIKPHRHAANAPLVFRFVVVADGQECAYQCTATPLAAEGTASGKILVQLAELPASDVDAPAAAALRQTEARFATAFNSNPAPVCITRETDGCYLDANPAYLTMVGYRREELIGHSPVDLGIVSAEYNAQLYELAIRRGSPLNLDARLSAKDGRQVDVVTSSVPAELDGELCRIVSALDVTARKQLEAKNSLLAAAVNASADAIVVLDLEGVVLTWNDAAAGFFGYSAEQAVGLRMYELFPGGDTARWRTYPDLLRNGKAIAIPDIHWITKEGRGVDLSATLSPIYAAHGTVVGAVLVDRDVTDRKRAEEAVREALEQLRLATEAAGIGVWSWNFADDSLTWDDRMCEIFGIGAEQQAAGLSRDLWRSRVHPDDVQFTDRGPDRPHNIPHELTSSYRIIVPERGTRYVQSASIVEYDRDGKPWGMTGITRDITEQKMYERLLEDTNTALEQLVTARTVDLRQAIDELTRANAGKDAFMAAVSHELRTPLTGILGLAETLDEELRGPLNEYQKRYVSAIRESGDRLLGMINGIIRYTYAVSDAQPTQLEPCRLLELCAGSVRLARTKAEKKRQKIEMDVNPANLQILSDSNSIAQILDALLDNAVKFTPNGGRIGVDINPVESGKSVQIAVWDTGIGIAPAHRSYLFRPFTQVDQSLSRKYEGLGLGLAFVKRKVEILGGAVAVKSQEAIGSRFVVTLPASLPPPQR